MINMIGFTKVPIGTRNEIQFIAVPYHTRIYPIRVWDVPYAYAYGMVYCPI